MFLLDQAYFNPLTEAATAGHSSRFIHMADPLLSAAVFKLCHYALEGRVSGSKPPLFGPLR